MNKVTPEQNESSGLVLGNWYYWSGSGSLKKGANVVRLSTQLNQVLSMLIQHAPEVVTRQQFLDSVWQSKVVNEDALSRTIAELRKILGDSASEAKYIKTIPKSGYQWVQSIERLEQKKTRQLKSVVVIIMISVLTGGYLINQRESVTAKLVNAVTSANRVTSQPGMEQQSILSSDGKWLTYVTNRDDVSQIIIESIDDANQRQVVELARHRLSSPVFIPDQDLVIFTARDQVNCYLKSYHLTEQLFQDLSSCVFHVESRTVIFDEVMNKVFFIDSKNLNNQGKQVTGIFSLDLSTGEKKEVTFPDDISEQDLTPNISPDQKHLSFSRGNHSVRNIWLKDLSTGEERPLTEGEHYTVSHDWYGDEHIVFDSDMSGSRQLWIRNIHEQTSQLIGAYGAQHPSFDRENLIMTFQEVSYEANIWLYDLATDTLVRKVHSTKYDNYPEFSNEGDQFLFSSNRQDQSSIWLYDLNQDSEKLLLSKPGAKLTRPSWHSGDNKILATINDNRGYGTLVFDLVSKESYELDFGQGHMATIEHGGSYYALAKSANNNHHILMLHNDQCTQLPIEAVSRFMFLNDGRLVFSKTDEEGLYLYDIELNQVDLITDLVKIKSLNLWTAVNQAVYFDQGGLDAGLWRIDVNTGDLKLVTRYRPFSVGTSLSVNRSENQILMTRTDRAESDILKVNLK